MRSVARSARRASAPAAAHGVRQTPVWKKVDDAFWGKFQAVSSGKELAAMKSCYKS